jgi:hypothetical protein
MPNDVEQHRFPSHQPDNRQRRLNFNFAVLHQLLGVSLAALGPRSTCCAMAIAVMYGGMPDAMVAEVKHMPPVIELLGEARRRNRARHLRISICKTS